MKRIIGRIEISRFDYVVSGLSHPIDINIYKECEDEKVYETIRDILETNDKKLNYLYNDMYYVTGISFQIIKETK